MRNFLSVVTRSRLALLGTAIATAALLLFLIFVGMELAGHEGGPYLGILVYLLLPGLVFLGLLLIPIGVWRARKRERLGQAEPPLPVIDFNKATTRRALATFSRVSPVGVVVLASAIKGISCVGSLFRLPRRTVMQPIHAVQRSPHSRVLRRMPHRRRRELVHQVEDLGQLGNDRGHVQLVSDADPDPRAQPASGARYLRTMPLADEVCGRQARGAAAFL